jgi:crotonobetainyl-CoA:carnitine CoA-transferase CaiB-like acyl-CoA transferase
MTARDPFGRAAPGPLAGLLVADFSRVLAGPYCTMLLADLGATVIKVESPDGDETRHWRPPTHDGEASYYLSINRNKHSIVLDLRADEDLRDAHELARRADVVVENFKPGSLARFGLDYESVAARNPAVVYASITGFGRAAGAALPGYDLLVQALSGLMSVTGTPDGGPMRSGVAVFDVITGLHAGMGILAALRHRYETGEGQHVELELMTSALSGMVNQTAAYTVAGVVPHRMGNEHPSIYPYEPLPTAEGQLVLAVGNDGQFAALCRAIDRAELATDPRFGTAPQRSANREALRALLITALAGRTAQAWFDELSAARVPCAPILDVGEGIALAERLGLAPVAETGPAERPIRTIRNPITLSRTPPSYDFAPPALGGAADAVRRWLASPETRAGGA